MLYEVITVHRKAEITESVVAEDVVPGAVHENAVAAVADIVGLDHGTRRIPDIDA